MLKQIVRLLTAADMPAAASPDAPSAAFAPGSAVRVLGWAWEHGEFEFRATVVRPTSDTHLLVRVDDKMLFVVPAADCTAEDCTIGADAPGGGEQAA